MAKAKFLYVLSSELETRSRMWVKDETFKYPDGTQFFNLRDVSTDDLLKVKAQIASELESRMDYDEVVESNLEKLKEHIREAKGEVVAQLILQTMDRLEQVNNDEKRAKTRLEILKDEMHKRLEQDGEKEKTFAGLTVAHESKTVYAVDDGGWDLIFGQIVADCLEGQGSYNTDFLNESMEVVESLVKDQIYTEIGFIRERLRTNAMVTDVDLSDQIQLLDDLEANVETTNLLKDVDEEDLVEDVKQGLVRSLRSGLDDAESFEFLQKRLKNKTFEDLVKGGYALPKGIKTSVIREVKFKRNKK